MKEDKAGTYYCAFCGNNTFHNRNGICENTLAFLSDSEVEE